MQRVRDPYLDARDAGERVTDGEVLERPQLLEIVRRAQQANAEQAVVIAGDRNVRYEEVLKVMDILQQGQVKRVGLLARPAP